MEFKLLLSKLLTAKNMKFSIKGFFRECDQTANLVTFLEEILSGKLYFFYSDCHLTYPHSNNSIHFAINLAYY